MRWTVVSIGWIVCVGICFGGPWPASAQTDSTQTVAGAPAGVSEQPTGSAAGDVADVVVTARKRNERLLDVPESITALTASDIESRDATNLSALQQEVPGLRIVQLGPGTQRIELRGISQYEGQDTVGVYLDEVSVAGLQGADPDVRLIDLADVEVLRGPQPTLYGNNSVGGTIRYITQSPDLRAFGGSLLAEGGFVQDGNGHDRVDAVVNVPIIPDALAVRLVVDHDDTGGWINSPRIGKKDINDLDADTYRFSALWKPTDALTLSFVYQYQQEGQDGQNFAGPDRVTQAYVATPTADDFHFGNFVASYDFGPVTLVSSTGYYYRDSAATYDVTPFYAPDLGPGGIAPESTGGFSHSVVEEARIVSNDPGPLHYLLGGEYTDTRDFQATTIDTRPKGPLSQFLDFDETAYTLSQSWAVYASAGYDILPELNAEAGLRYYQDEETEGSDTFNFGGGRTFQQTTFHTLNPRFDLTYRTGDSGIVYANVAKGFRSGGFNPTPGPDVQKAFGPEKLWSYEIGAKQQFFGKVLTLQPAFYYNDYQNVQEQLPIPGNIQGNGFTLNVGKASGPGVDLAVLVRITDALSVSGVLGYNHVRIDSKSLSNSPGDPLNLVPDWTWSVSGDYKTPITDTVKLLVHADVSHTDTARITLRQLQATTFSSPYTIASLRVAADWSRYEFYAVVNNLLDTNRIVQPAFGGYAEPIWTTPRTVIFGAKATF